jgi:Flp pilus assembly protein TadG
MLGRFRVPFRRRNQRGNGMVETALCLQAFILLAVGGMEFSWYVYAYDFATFAASDAAHYASTRGSHYPTPATSDSITTHVKNEAAILDKTKITVTTTWTPDNTPGSTVKVKVQYTIVPITKLFIKSNTDVTASSTYVISN